MAVQAQQDAARIAELEAQLAAVGAGGVTGLRNNPDKLDAERYRWLRNESWACYNIAKGKPEVAMVAVISDGSGNIQTILAEEAMDDREISAEEMQ